MVVRADDTLVGPRSVWVLPSLTFAHKPHYKLCPQQPEELGERENRECGENDHPSRPDFWERWVPNTLELLSPFHPRNSKEEDECNSLHYARESENAP